MYAFKLKVLTIQAVSINVNISFEMSTKEKI